MVLSQRKLCFINWWIFFRYNIVACCFQTGVIYDCPTWSSSPLLCVLFRSKGAFQYNAHFFRTFILLGPQNGRYNEVAVHIASESSLFLLMPKPSQQIYWTCHPFPILSSPVIMAVYSVRLLLCVTTKALCNLFVLKVLLNPNQSISPTHHAST